MSKRHKAEVAFAALVDEYNSLYEQNAKLVEALQKYGRHQNNPKHMCEKIKHSDHPCTCGWDDLLKENCQHLNRELVNMSDVMCTDCKEMVNHELE